MRNKIKSFGDTFLTVASVAGSLYAGYQMDKGNVRAAMFYLGCSILWAIWGKD